jgi:cytochrome c oxidase accessory protein FixG
MTSRELPQDRLATADEEGKRVWLYPADVKGKYRTRRKWVSAALINFFLFLPWIRIGGHQAVLLDIPQRRFAIFGITFWAHDAPMLLFVAGGAVLTLAFVTAVWGRVWCGWACPQTVFIVSVFRRIERWVEGDAVERRRRDEGPATPERTAKRALKWALFTLVSLVISHSFLAYFVGTQKLAQMIASSPLENPGSFLIMAFVTGLVLFDFGWFREQFCTIVCPYGRFQSVLMDDRSTAVVYDTRRGEPRRGVAAPDGPIGDCVNCYKCVQVCPTGIDIRRGAQQLECIACTACMDACDDVMSRLKKPQGLIRYASVAEIQGKPTARGARPWAYGALIVACITGLTLTVRDRTAITVGLIRAAEAPYQVIPGENGSQEVVNHYKLEIRNQSFDRQAVEILVPKEFQDKGVKIVVSNHAEGLEGGESERADLFIRFPKTLLNLGKGEINLEFSAKSDARLEPALKKEVRLVGPFI